LQEAEIEKREDEEVIELVFQDKEFFGVLIRRYEGRLTKYVGRIAGTNKEMIEDIVQNIFIKAFVNINSFKKNQKFGSWLYGIAHNECIDNWRKYKKHACNVSLDCNEELLAVLASDEDIEQALIGKDRRDSIKKSLEKLPIKFKEVLVLKYLEDKDYEEIGSILKKPTSTVGTLLRRAKERFKKILTENE
jgi:RNA polymerase sigma-70 factor (ECF subfamily)